jgi:hypothetical protein
MWCLRKYVTPVYHISPTDEAVTIYSNQRHITRQSILMPHAICISKHQRTSRFPKSSSMKKIRLGQTADRSRCSRHSFTPPLIGEVLTKLGLPGFVIGGRTTNCDTHHFIQADPGGRLRFERCIGCPVYRVYTHCQWRVAFRPVNSISKVNDTC